MADLTFLFPLIVYHSPLTFTHPMPNSVVLLTVHQNRIDAEVQIPLSELQAAVGRAVNDSAMGLVGRLGPFLRTYLSRHIRPETPDGRPWTVQVGALSLQETQNPINGVYRELTAQIRLLPPIRPAAGPIQSGPIRAGADVRRFVLRYDAVLHQVVTHKILVSVRQDWARGMVESPVQVGIIELDIVNNRIPPLVVNLETGSTWQGFVAMVRLGIRHIAEGTDHLLFLLVLLLAAPLLPERGRWGGFGGTRYSLRRILLIVTAFTVGHSLTLLAGAIVARHPGWLRLPSQPIEILITVSILVSALHALRPLFPGREAWVAAGFGIIHGLAFANTLTNLQLDGGPMVLSILGFNLGIEAMQLFIIALTLPWLMLLSRTRAYGPVRVGGAIFGAAAAIAWVVERITGQANAVERVAGQAGWLLAGLALLTIGSWYLKTYKSEGQPV